jgi:hypothetical protein
MPTWQPSRPVFTLSRLNWWARDVDNSPHRSEDPPQTKPYTAARIDRHSLPCTSGERLTPAAGPAFLSLMRGPPSADLEHSVGHEPRALATINSANLVGVGSVLEPCGTPSPGSDRAHRTCSPHLRATRQLRTVLRPRRRTGRSSCGPCVARRCRPAGGGASRWFCGPCSGGRACRSSRRVGAAGSPVRSLRR